MQGYLPGYQLDSTTWVYLSSLLTIGVFFKFNRFWCVRNLDLIGLIGFGPGLLWIAERAGAGGYIWLFTLGSFFLVRLLLDPLMVRRPLLEPNLNASGLTFTGIAMLAFLLSNVVAGDLFPLAKQPISSAAEVQPSSYPLLYALADLSGEAEGAAADPTRPERSGAELARVTAVRTLAILAHLAMVMGIALIGYRHFGNLHTGVAMASLYLLLSYTAEMTPRVDHVVPGALLVWAVAFYRRPALAGMLIGLAAGLIGYPLFLLPLWCSFFWRRGLIRFLFGVVLGLALLVVLLAIVLGVLALVGVGDAGPMALRVREMFAWARLPMVRADGFWQNHPQALRIPVMAAFCVLCASLALWPAQKNLGTLMSCSAAVMLGVQFWHPYHGGVYLAWYVPLLLLTVFRPNLEDRLAVSAVTEAWAPWQTAGWSSWRVEQWLPWRKEAWVVRRRRWLFWPKSPDRRH